MLTLMFARDYCDAIGRTDTGLPLHNAFTQAANSLTCCRPLSPRKWPTR